MAGPRRRIPRSWCLLGAAVGLLIGWFMGFPGSRESLASFRSTPDAKYLRQADRRFAWTGSRWLAEKEEPNSFTFAAATELAARLTRNHPGTFRLPSPAEWEQAARGGLSQKRFPWGNQPPTPKRLATPNPFGLLNMAGGLAEWCADGTLRGGSWAEDADEQFEIKNIVRPRADYDGTDAGARLLWEP